MIFRPSFQILIILLVVIIVYFPTFSAEVCIVDDQDAISDIFNSETIGLKEIFLPDSEQGGYYRPLIGLAYYIDKVLWDMSVRAMHIENVFMHFVNAVLVYFLAFVSIRYNKKEYHPLLPMMAGLVFALHPIATESVNWISGRTDPMAANFVILSAVLFIIYKTNYRIKYLYAGFLMILLGVLAKESSLGMLLAGGLILYADENNHDDSKMANSKLLLPDNDLIVFLLFYSIICFEVIVIGNYWFAIAVAFAYFLLVLIVSHHHDPDNSSHIKSITKISVALAGCSSVAVGIYLLLRRVAFRSDVGKISQTIKLIFEDTGYAISVFLGAAGFYVKKFFLPLPLNFYILEIDPLYDLAGVFVLLFCLYLLTRLTLVSVLFLTGVCLFIPALPFAFGTIAWTGYAERYIYISTAFWTVSCLLSFNEVCHKHVFSKHVFVSLITVLIVVMGTLTFQRNMVWQRNVTLLADTLAKSPNRVVVRDMYMQALFNDGQFEKLKQDYAKCKAEGILLSDSADMIMARVLDSEGRLEEAILLSESAVLKNRKNDKLLNYMIKLIDKMITTDKSNSKFYQVKKHKFMLQLLEVSNNPMVLYNMGQKAISDGDKHLAISFFAKARQLFSSGNPYREYSSRLISNLDIAIQQGQVRNE